MRRWFAALGVAVLAFCALVSVAAASHPRVGGGTPVRFPLVPAFTQCSSVRNVTHVAPHAYGACVLPVIESPRLSTGTAGSMSGTFRLDVICNDGQIPPCAFNAGEQEDDRVTFSTTSCLLFTVLESQRAA